MPFLSIIVPAYNVENYIRQCVDSILNQHFTDFELLLVDDGSKDGTGRICDDYAKNDIRVRVIHKQNGGLVSARKAGITEAQGEYVAYVDGDDWVAEEMFERHNIIARALIAIGVSEATAFEDSCKIEHDISSESFEKIKNYLERVTK